MEVNATSLNSEFKFKDGTARNVPRISKEKWEEHKELLCSLYQEKTILEIVAFMQNEHDFIANAGQLGRKLRDWGVYKYDSKNRSSSSAHGALDVSNIPQAIPIMLVDAELQNSATHHPQSTDASATAPPAAHGSPVPDTDSELPPLVQTDISWWIEKILQMHDALQPLVRLIREREQRRELTSSSNIWLGNLSHFLSVGAVPLPTYYAIFLERFGRVHAPGNLEALMQLINIAAQLETTVLFSLQSAWVDGVRPNYMFLRSELQSIKAQLTLCLSRLSHKLSAAEDSTRPEHSMSYPMPSKWVPEIQVYSDKGPQDDSESTGEFRQIGSVQERQELAESATSTAPALRTMVEEPEHGRLSDIDMDRFSAISLTPSSLSGFASLRSLARRIKRGESPAQRNSADDLPSSVMKWNRSSGSLQLFGRLSSRLSVASSRKTDCSQMSWRPEIPAIIQEDDGVAGDGIFARFRLPKGVKISAPENPLHMIHVRYDSATRQFTGLPKDWQGMLTDA